MADQLIRATAAEGGIRAVGVVATRLTDEARRRHKLSYVATAALGRTMSAGLLFSSSLKHPDARINIHVRGDGPLGKVVVDARPNGTVRGFVDHPEVELPPTANGKLDVGGAVGHTGFVDVVRDMGQGYLSTYSSTVELVSGEIGDDLTHYLLTSEQTPSALLLGVFVDVTGVTAAGGLLIQVLPKAARDETLVELLESRIASLSGFTPLLQAGKTIETIFQELLGDLGLEILPEVQLVRFQCNCSHDRALGALKLFGIPELEDMIDKDNGAEAICEFCGNVYRADRDQLSQLITEIRADSGS